MNRLNFIAQIQDLKSSPPILNDDPTQRVEIALVGRSNVGKSTLLNAISSKKIAKISSTPGKTRGLIFFQAGSVWFVDLPGYGYAKVSKKTQTEFSDLTDIYLSTRKSLKLILFLMDMRHLPSKLDLEMKRWLDQKKIPYMIILTKKDKLKPSKVIAQQNSIAKTLDFPLEDLYMHSLSSQKESLFLVKKMKEALC